MESEILREHIGEQYNQRPQILRGWPVTKAMEERTHDWYLKHYSERAQYSIDGLSCRRRNFRAGTIEMARNNNMEAAIELVYSKQIKKKLLIFAFDTNDVVPAERFTDEQWKRLAEHVGVDDEPQWYLAYVPQPWPSY